MQMQNEKEETINYLNPQISTLTHDHKLVNDCCFEPQRAFNFKSVPATISFRLENENWGEVFKMHPVLTVTNSLIISL
jgi:hypothetical protein